MYQFSGKTNNFDFLAQICPKMDLGSEIQKTKYWNKNQHRQDAMDANFQEKQTTLTFSTQICPKKKLRFEIQKTNLE